MEDNRLAYERYRQWCQQRGFSPAPFDTWLMVTANILASGRIASV